jgi:hypothetical protein
MLHLLLPGRNDLQWHEVTPERLLLGRPWFQTSAQCLVSMNEISHVRVEVLTEVSVKNTSF